MTKRKFRPLQNPNIQGLIVLLVIMAIAGFYIFNNRRPTQSVARPAPPPSPTPPELQDWQVALQQELLALPSPTPSVTPSPTFFVPPTSTFLPTVPPANAGTGNNTLPTQPNVIIQASPIPPELITPSPSFIRATPVPLPEGVDVAALAPPVFEDNPQQFQLPPEQVPLSAHPYDHYYFTRPIDVSANSRSLFYYPYGSSGTENWRVHHGVDMPNLIGEQVHSAGAGTVIWASQAYATEVDGDLEVYAAYGNVVVIQHDFGWGGQKVWTLYAHLSAITVQVGEIVEAGDTIGLVGTTGNVTGPHVHFEVRLGRNSYYSTRNPLLWMAPYIGHGVVAGRVTDENGLFIDNVLVQLNQNGRLTDSTTTYQTPYTEGKRIWSVVPDDNWNENFVMGDIPAGTYQLVVVVNDDRYFQTVTVNAGSTAFVEMRLDELATPQSVQATAILPTLIPTAIPTATPE